MSRDDELRRMPSPPKTLPDASSAKFMAHLGFDVRQDHVAQLYRQMKGDAVQAHRRICSDRRNLLPYLQRDPSIRSPFTVTQITEQALQDEAFRMHAEARGRIKEIYDSAAAMQQEAGGSWAARWMLWHVFLRGGEDESPPSEEGVARKQWAFDPYALQARMERMAEWTDASRRPLSSPRRSTASPNAEAGSPSENRRYWDPVRHS